MSNFLTNASLTRLLLFASATFCLSIPDLAVAEFRCADIFVSDPGPEDRAAQWVWSSQIKQNSWIRVVRNPLQQKLLELSASDRLLDQTHKSLGDRGLLVEGGGLCASTCGSFVSEAVSHLASQADSAPLRDDAIHNIVNSVRKYHQKDARYGTYLADLKQGILANIRNEGLSSRVGFSEWNSASPNAPALHLRDLMPEKAILPLVSIELDPKFAHAIVITGVSEGLDAIHFIDPNRPNGEYVAKLRYGQFHGIDTVFIEDPYSDNSWVRIRAVLWTELKNYRPPVEGPTLSDADLMKRYEHLLKRKTDH